MKKNHIRGISLALVIVLLVSLLASLILPARAADYVYNWGSRGTVATELSAYARAFYSGSSYEELAMLDGSESLGGVPGSELYQRLQSLMAGSHTHRTDYDETKDLYRYTDCQNGTGPISSFYSGESIGPDWDGTWNREHTWPNSKGLAGDDEDDIMMLRPTASTENSARGNKAYGASSGFYNPNGESGGKYDLRGDVSRIALYVYVRWGNATNMWGSDGVIESKEVLLSWMEADPVDTWELGRNDAVQSITGTRNVFVDYPELAFLLFEEEIPETMVTPSGKAGQSFTVTATVNDDTMGTVSLSGKNINAVPKEGYAVEGYRLVSGSAEVTRNGNAFTVSAYSDCTVEILFAPKVAVELSFLSDGTALATDTVYSGDVITLPEYQGTAPEGYRFLGWSEESVSHVEDVPVYFAPGASYTVEEDTSLQALFSYVASGMGSGVWTRVTEDAQLSAGAQVVFASIDKSVVSAAMQEAYLFKENAVFSADFASVTAMPENAQSFTLGGSAGAWTFANEEGQLLGATNVKKLAYDKGTTTWTVTVENGNATVASTTSSYGRFLYNAGSPRFTTYTSAAGGSMLLPQLYVLDTSAGVTYYTTASCLHSNTEEVAAKAATCTQDGYTAGVFCSDCNSYISGHGLLAATGHSYTAQVTPPTAQKDGFTAYSCTVCGHSYEGDVVPALGESYTVTFSVPVDAAKVEDMSCNRSGIVLPQAQVPAEAADTWEFLGWTLQPVENAETAPQYYEAGETYVAEENVTLYALYVATEGGSGETSFVLVEELSQLTAGSRIVIAAAEADVALATQQNGNNRGQAKVTKNADKTLSFGDDTACLTLGEGTQENTWSFHCPVNEGYLYAASGSKNYLRTKSALDDNGSFAIVLGENGAATVTAQGNNTRNLLRYNRSNKIFACYGSGQEDVCFYIETVDGTVTYTTVIAHTHQGTYQEAVAATCEQEGTVAHYSCGCGMKFADGACTQVLTEVAVAKKAHSFTAEKNEDAYQKSAATCASPALYYISCEACGLSSRDTAWESTFSGKEKDAENHVGETTLSGQKAATCTADGYTGDKVCTGCEKVLEAGKVIPAEHSLKKVEAVAATHQAAGNVAYYQCTVCLEFFADEQAKESLKPEDVVLPQIAHSFGSWEKDENKHWKECDCGEIGSDGKHTFGSWKTVKKADEGVKGEKQRKCTACGYTESKEIPATDGPVTGDALIAVTLLIMVCAVFGVYLLVTLRTPGGKYLR